MKYQYCRELKHRDYFVKMINGFIVSTESIIWIKPKVDRVDG